jgi:hypothetical protein
MIYMGSQVYLGINITNPVVIGGKGQIIRDRSLPNKYMER